ncbi:MAG: hypothetical protein ACRDNW_08285 [Trebonia sp.]
MGAAVGPFIGGWLIAAVSWRLIFVINLPIAVVVAVVWRHVPESRDVEATAPIDVAGGALVTAGLTGLTYGLIPGPANGWTSGPVLAALAGGVLLLAAFAGREHRSAAPMLPLSLFSSAQFTAAYRIDTPYMKRFPHACTAVGGFKPDCPRAPDRARGVRSAGRRCEQRAVVREHVARVGAVLGWHAVVAIRLLRRPDAVGELAARAVSAYTVPPAAIAIARQAAAHGVAAGGDPAEPRR